MVSYQDVSIAPEESMTLTIPVAEDIADGRSLFGADIKTEYSYANDNGQDILIECELVGEEAEQAYYKIDAKSNNEAYGRVEGSGSRQYGNYAKVSAYPHRGKKFLGWYSGSKLISTEKDFRFKVTDDVALIGVFEVVFWRCGLCITGR